ncbi:MAG: hypothetical protein FJ390_08500 [Verrucomicrobia bacterium]|nr:hypothetical protein [Alphaproteobacteria bacterium]MBM3857978.1 hypothetical protein [Verrucomicrobiota bacterium]
MPQFDVTTFSSQIFWLLICFAFLCIIMAKFLVPRLIAVLEEREHRIQEDRNQADILNAKRETLRKENLASLADARSKAHALLHQAMQEAHQTKANRISFLDDELITKTKKIRSNIELQAHKILSNIDPLVSQVVKSTAPRLLGQPLSLKQIEEILKKKRKIN